MKSGRTVAKNVNRGTFKTCPSMCIWDLLYPMDKEFLGDLRMWELSDTEGELAENMPQKQKDGHGVLRNTAS
jgi:hypothetical protein